MRGDEGCDQRRTGERQIRKNTDERSGRKSPPSALAVGSREGGGGGGAAEEVVAESDEIASSIAGSCGESFAA